MLNHGHLTHYLRGHDPAALAPLRGGSQRAERKSLDAEDRAPGSFGPTHRWSCSVCSFSHSGPVLACGGLVHPRPAR
jgi:hypothetical protein